MPKWIGNRVGDDAQAPNVVLNGGVFATMDQFWCEINPTIGWNAALVPLPGRFTLSNGTGVETPDSYFTLFSSSGSVTLAAGPVLNCEYVVVGGGGGGGNANFTGSYNYGGGGGAGGFRTGTLTSVSAGTYPVVIGAGGVPVGGQTTPIKPAGTPGNNGAQTTWNSITSEGGGAGGGGAPGETFAKGENGGSGGGSGGYNWPTTPSGNRIAGTTGPAPTQGNDGAPGPGGGGGGGAGGAGSNPTGPGPKVAGAGGAGLIAFNSPGTYAPNIPTDFGAPGPAAGRWFAAGGGGGDQWFTGSSPGAGGAGGGGAGGVTNGPGGAATVKTGSGGGGAGRDYVPPSTPTTKNRGGTAGDGVVLIRWYK